MDFNIMIGHYLYKDNIPIGSICDIKELENGIYKVMYEGFDDIIKIQYFSKVELLKIYKEFLIRSERVDFLVENNVSTLIHFTKLDNLESILEYGLLSRNMLDNNNITYKYSDIHRYDAKLDYINTSISHPNYKMFYKKRCEDSSVDWVILTINSEVMVHKLDTLFYHTNSASSIFSDNDEYHVSNDALYKMFDKNNRPSDLASYYPTDVQAEVLIKDKIDRDYIIGATCNTFKGSNTVESICKNSGLVFESYNYFEKRK